MTSPGNASIYINLELRHPVCENENLHQKVMEGQDVEFVWCNFNVLIGYFLNIENLSLILEQENNMLICIGGGWFPKLVWPKHNMINQQVKVGVANNDKRAKCWCGNGRHTCHTAFSTHADLIAILFWWMDRSTKISFCWRPIPTSFIYLFIYLFIVLSPTGHRTQ